MNNNRSRYFFIEICVCFILFAFTFADEQECDKSKCLGPLRFYEDIRCTPIYKNSCDCCAVKYDCSHLEKRSKTKCYSGGNAYEIGEQLREEDARPCDIGCFCDKGDQEIPSFICAVVDCFNRVKPGCYLERDPKKCCPGPEVCPTKFATCHVNGKDIKEGDYFEIGDPNTYCYCKPGYKGENVEPFCHTRNETHGACGTEQRNNYALVKKCAPVFYPGQTPQTSCGVAFRCQNNNDIVIQNPENIGKPIDDESEICTFGTLKMQIGDELNQPTDDNPICVKCKCEVPPTPTCQQLPNEECNAANF